MVIMIMDVFVGRFFVCMGDHRVEWESGCGGSHSNSSTRLSRGVVSGGGRKREEPFNKLHRSISQGPPPPPPPE